MNFFVCDTLPVNHDKNRIALFCGFLNPRKRALIATATVAQTDDGEIRREHGLAE